MNREIYVITSFDSIASIHHKLLKDVYLFKGGRSRRLVGSLLYFAVNWILCAAYSIKSLHRSSKLYNHHLWMRAYFWTLNVNIFAVVIPSIAIVFDTHVHCYRARSAYCKHAKSSQKHLKLQYIRVMICFEF